MTDFYTNQLLQIRSLLHQPVHETNLDQKPSTIAQSLLHQTAAHIWTSNLLQQEPFTLYTKQPVPKVFCTKSLPHQSTSIQTPFTPNTFDTKSLFTSSFYTKDRLHQKTCTPQSQRFLQQKPFTRRLLNQNSFDTRRLLLQIALQPNTNLQQSQNLFNPSKYLLRHKTCLHRKSFTPRSDLSFKESSS